MTARRGLEVFLFGCRASSGSAQAWKIGAPHAYFGVRRAIGEWSGAVVEGAEWGRVAGMWRMVGGEEE